ncbi:MAG: hypothetical protein ACYC9K_04245 [Sulfuricaulis sp.]
MNKPLPRLFIILPLLMWLAACVGMQTFTPAARPGDTVALAVGWQKNLARQNLTVTITDALGAITTYAPNDSHVRGIVNMYPDPVSRAVVGTMTNQDLGYQATNTGNLINSFVTNSPTGEHDNDWWQTTMFLDLPTTLATGTATISIADSAGATIQPASITIVPGTGNSNLFTVYSPWGSTLPMSQYWPLLLGSMERADRYTVTFNSYKDANGAIVVPHSIQVGFSHTPNVGKTWVVNPRADIKNVVWNDDGTNIQVILTPTQGKTLSQMLDFKFYVAGGIAGLAQAGLKAYDKNGNLMSGVTATVQ